MQHSNFFTFKIPKGRKVNFKMLAKVYGQHMAFDYGDDNVACSCKVFLYWGIN